MANIMAIPITVINCQSPIGCTSDNIQEDAVIAAAIPTKTKSKSCGLTPVNLKATTPAAILSILNATTANIADIKIPVKDCGKVNGFIKDNIQEDAVIAKDIDTKVFNNSKGLTFNFLNITAAINIFSKYFDKVANIPAIKMAVSN